MERRDRPGAPAPWAAVVVNHDAGSLLDRCVRSLEADRSAGGPPEIVVVDNASRDGSADRVAVAFPDARVVRAPGNVGYARAANLGTSTTDSDAEVVAVLNPDVEVRPGAAAVVLERFASEPDLGAVGPRVDDPDGTRYPSARSVPSVVDAVGHGILGFWWPRNPFSRRYRQLDVDPERRRDVDWVSGAAIWLRREAIDAVGGWDERYFMYVEDVDLCWRLRRGGWRVSYEPAASVVHVQGASTRRRPYRMILEHHRSLWRFAHRRFRGGQRVLLVPAALYLGARALLAVAVHAARARAHQGGERRDRRAAG